MIGWVGCGKLGFPCAVALAQHHDVLAYDPNVTIAPYFDGTPYPHDEAGLADLLRSGRRVVQAASLAAVVAHCDLIFVAVQTPHGPEYEGVTRVPHTRADFDYAYLTDALSDIWFAAHEQGRHVTVAIISTVLPGTIDRDFRVRFSGGRELTLLYNPFFIAMGTSIADFLTPEFVLIGAAKEADAEPLRRLYATLHDRPVFVTSYVNAEMVKVFYNVLIGFRIVTANTFGEFADRLGGNVDAVTHILSHATDRIISTRYMRAGGGDGGACHPRDAIALSWLSDNLKLPFNLADALMRSREKHAEGIVNQARALAKLEVGDGDPLPVVIMGKAYKPGTRLTIGAWATLLANLLREKGIAPTHYDPYLDATTPDALHAPACFIVATAHDVFSAWAYPKGSVVLDPWGITKDQDGVRVVRVGRRG